ncbi:MAG TPA: hypothetical protein VFX52_16210 [Nocardioidaceae bacterium]|nr:hypothetical protein [Nocardioidaceae bacterium]
MRSSSSAVRERRPVLLATADLRLLETVAHDTGAPVNRLGRHRAEQDLLLVRLAADTGARRGELAALRLTSLRGTTLHIDRAISGRQLTPPKSGRGRMLTVGTTTATLWHQLVSEWTPQPVTDTEADDPHATLGPWLFSADLDHRHRLGRTSGHPTVFGKPATPVVKIGETRAEDRRSTPSVRL